MTAVKTNKIIFISLTLVVVGLLVAAMIYWQTSSSSPSYNTVTPSHKSIDQLGGWQRVSPPQNDPVYAYSDEINGVAVTVSQQPLPKSFRKDTKSQVAKMAKEFNATNEIDADNTTLYLGTSAKGPQSVILAKNNLLILIKSESSIEVIAWINYVNSLK